MTSYRSGFDEALTLPARGLHPDRIIPKGGFVAKKTYRKPTLRRLGLLRKMTRFSFPVE